MDFLVMEQNPVSSAYEISVAYASPQLSPTCCGILLTSRVTANWICDYAGRALNIAATFKFLTFTQTVSEFFAMFVNSGLRSVILETPYFRPIPQALLYGSTNSIKSTNYARLFLSLIVDRCLCKCSTTSTRSLQHWD